MPAGPRADWEFATLYQVMGVDPNFHPRARDWDSNDNSFVSSHYAS